MLAAPVAVLSVGGLLALGLSLLNWAGNLASDRLPQAGILHDETIAPDVWVALYGSVVAAAIGGASAVLVLQLSRRIDRKHALSQERIRLTTELGDFMREVAAVPAEQSTFDYMLHVDSVVREDYGPRITRLWTRDDENSELMKALGSAIMTLYVSSRESEHYEVRRYLSLVLAPAISSACYDLAAHEHIKEFRIEAKVDFNRRIRDLRQAERKRVQRLESTGLEWKLGTKPPETA
ncbi:hypothetical protein EDL96_09590 [Kocuria soli]|uniref:Uncharacterized protein n=1 Tax=Kocuria soli TaxID=2485125 RepID=A0A3N3ZRK9_9MICC|nr:hypothetical protein EDL96_09590 [Kocuria soli]